MPSFIARQIMKTADASLTNGQTKYKVYFVNTHLYEAWRSEVNVILQTTITDTYPNGYSAVIALKS